MKLVCWNVRGGGKPGSWDVLEQLEPDVALLQEAVVPDAVRERFDVFEDAPIRRRSATRQRWKTVVLVRRGAGLSASPVSFSSAGYPWLGSLLEESGCCIAVELRVGSSTSLVVSLYSPAWPLPSASRLSEEQLQEVRLPTHTGDKVWVADLLWAWLRARKAGSVIVGGDFNSTPAFDRAHGGRSKGNVIQHQRFVDLGLTDLVRLVDSDFRKTPTFRHAKGKLYQLDYVYASNALRQEVLAVRIGERGLWGARLSDHLPICVSVSENHD